MFWNNCDCFPTSDHDEQLIQIILVASLSWGDA